MSNEYDLILKAQRGDGRALNDLVTAYMPLVLAIARTFHVNGEELKDMVQVGSIGLMNAARTFKVDGDANFKTYASHCIRNIMCDELKRHKNDVHADQLDEMTEADTGEPETMVIEKESWRRVYDLIYSSIKQNERDVLELYLSGMSYDEIANKLGVSKKKVDNTLFNLRKKIQNILRNNI